MKKYYTLVQPFNEQGTTLAEYFRRQDIPFSLGADRVDELMKLGFSDPNLDNDAIVKRYIVLLEEHELTAIQLTLDHVQILSNEPMTERRNQLRKAFAWFVD